MNNNRATIKKKKKDRMNEEKTNDYEMDQSHKQHQQHQLKSVEELSFDEYYKSR